MPGVGSSSTATLAKGLDGPLAELDVALATVRREHREAEQALVERDRVIAAWTDIYQSCASIAEGLLRLAGRPELAARVRPTERRARGEEAVEIAEAPAEAPAGVPAEVPGGTP